ncbi:branched-chain amino acid ABC transporter permease [Azospirillum sp. ST 5-10]|uniref:branched-chain amino acid ABC transporter permease n=1 Tax=unclassified Azospirillum TaxID=2630922 RepID=UPI003F49D363
MARPPPALLLLLLPGLAACGVDRDQAQACRRFIPAFEADPAAVRVVEEAYVDDALRLRYTTGGGEHWIACRFAGRYLDQGRLEVTGVATDRTGPLTGMRFLMLRLWAELPAHGRPGPAVDAAADRPEAPPSRWAPAAFFAQQTVNAATLACVYGLLAIGYTLVYGILGQIILAMGELTMIGAMLAAMAAAGLAVLGLATLPAALLAALVLVMAFTAVHGWTMDRLVFRHVRGVHTHTPLIAAIGLSIALQEGVRLLHGAREWWPRPVFATRHDLWTAGHFTVTALTSQAVILALTALLYLGLRRAMARTAYGRAHRACADDVGAAALMGLDIDRTVAVTFAVGGAYAAAAGFVIALYYGGINFFTGYLIGFKALAAAVVGGIGSIPGALLGAALLALLETFWSAYGPLAYKDVAGFALLTLFLILRPHGLLGTRAGRGD